MLRALPRRDSAHVEGRANLENGITEFGDRYVCGHGGRENLVYSAPVGWPTYSRSDAVIKNRHCGKSRTLAEIYDDH